jgi:adenosylmethionine-8-amino-7-oxononanoate aminotransferase
VLSREAQSAVQAPPHVGLGGAVGHEARRRGLLLRFSPWIVAVAPPLVSTEDEIVHILDAAVSTVEETLLPQRHNGRAGATSA